jgi:hypothetical protein
LLLISVVAIALIVSSGTETAMAGNYRTATGVYYAALAGLEEARGRLLAKNAGSFKNTASTLIPTPLPIGQPVYIINPVGSETVAPWVPGSTYADGEYSSEFPASAGYSLPNPSPSTASVSTVAGLQGPSYKWVRINAVSENSLNIYVDGDTAKNSQVLYYDSTQSKLTKNSSGTQQVFEITSFAILPNGSQKLLQYLVTPTQITLPPFLAALTLSGSHGDDPVFHPPASNTVYAVKGDDYNCSNPPAPTGLNPHAAIGFFGGYTGGNYNSAQTALINGIPSNVSGTDPQLNYTGLGPAPPTTNPPDVEYLSTYPANMQTPSQLDAIVNSIALNADATIPAGSTPNSVTYPLSTFTQANLTPLGMSSTNPLTVVINGNLDVTNWTGTGYGLLLVIGKFTYDPATTWNGIVLVIGQGAVNNIDHGQYQQMNGAVFVAQTRDTNGNLLPQIGGASVSFDPTMQGNGIRYSSCWIQQSLPTSGYKILSFHEISQ